MIYLLFILVALIAFRAGFHYRELVEQVKTLRELPETRRKLKQQAEESPSTIIDPDNLTQMLELDREATMRRLNPEQDDES